MFRKNDYITNDLEFMNATATETEIEKFTVLKGDVIIRKDSEEATDIAVPTFVKEDLLKNGFVAIIWL